MTMRDWSGDATEIFKGKTVSHIDYLTDSEMDEMGWYSRAPVIVFTDKFRRNFACVVEQRLSEQV